MAHTQPTITFSIWPEDFPYIGNVDPRLSDELYNGLGFFHISAITMVLPIGSKFSPKGADSFEDGELDAKVSGIWYHEKENNIEIELELFDKETDNDSPDRIENLTFTSQLALQYLLHPNHEWVQGTPA